MIVNLEGKKPHSKYVTPNEYRQLLDDAHFIKISSPDDTEVVGLYIRVGEKIRLIKIKGLSLAEFGTVASVRFNNTVIVTKV